jgi:hypothetical protein
VGDVGWVCLVPDRKVLKAPLNILMSLQIIEHAGKCVAYGATVTGIFEKRFL